MEISLQGMAKFKYEFVKVKASFFQRKPVENYREIVETKACEGWRLVQILAPGTGPYGAVGYYELIFEKEK